jgi:hypothetical protein
MTYSDLIIKPQYIKKDGSNVIDIGSVVIEGIEHRVNRGWVYCNLNLNQRSWGTTPKIGVCPKCFPDYKAGKMKIMKVEQLKLF